MKKVFGLVVWISLFVLSGCIPDVQNPSQPLNETVCKSESSIEQNAWCTYLSNIELSDLEQINWLIYPKEYPSDSQVVELLRNAANKSVPGADFETAFWTVSMYIDPENDSDLNPDELLYLEAGIEEPLVKVTGESNMPDGEIILADEDLYMMIRTSMDVPVHFDEPEYIKYQNVVDQYVSQKETTYSDDSVKVELCSFNRIVDRQDISVLVYTIGTVVKVAPPEDIMDYLAGGGYIDSELHLHQDGYSGKPNLLVVDGVPVGFLSWNCLEETSYLSAFNSKEELLDSLYQSSQWFERVS